jgi:hypothetical protein
MNFKNMQILGTRCILFVIVFLLTANASFAQESYPYTCDVDFSALTAKYWQYRENFNKHFIKIDRNEAAGCVNDGIGQNPNETCKLGKNGLSLPATSINLGPAHAGGSERKLPWQQPPTLLTDEDCFGPNFYDAPSYNYLDMGSETLTQLGWYIMMLCTEYELFRRNNQVDDQKETLEELFLALQSIKRLDIMANCYLADLYKLRLPDAPVALCPPVFLTNPDRPNFYAWVVPSCNFTPQTDGYSGFLLREDATRDALISLNDQSDPMYNIKLISSANSFISKPCKPQSQQQGACYLLHQQAFFSQDQIIGLMKGLVFIKKYIPDDAIVTTCAGHTYNVLKTAQDITWAICHRIGEDEKTSIWLPGTDNNCTAVFGSFEDKSKIYLSNQEGGNVRWLFYGIGKACKYITGKEAGISAGNELRWFAFKYTLDTYDENFYLPFPLNFYANWYKDGINSNHALFIEAESIATDNGGHYDDDDFSDRVKDLHKEIMPLINNTLYPSEPNAPVDQSKFLTMMCNAPCTGQCQKNKNYDEGVPNSNPPFECANTPGWLGQRWDGAGSDSKILGNENLQSRIFNGLDFMVLYNLYALNYASSAPFYKPENIADPSSGAIGKDNSIVGSGFICMGDTKYYEIKPHYTSTNNTFDDIIWNSSAELLVNSPNDFATNVQRIGQNNQSLLKVKYTENRPKTAVIRTEPYTKWIKEGDEYRFEEVPASYNVTGYINDHCYNQGVKPISNELPQFTIFHFADPCYTAFKIEGDEMADFNFSWNIHNNQNGQTKSFTGEEIELYEPFYNDYYDAVINITINIAPKTPMSCQPSIIQKTFFLKKCTGKDPKLIRVTPNPNIGVFNVELEDANMSIPAGGLDLYLINTNTGTAVGQYQMNQSSLLINAGNQPPGNYKISTIIQGQPTETSFIIIQ